MPSKTVQVATTVGLHARPAAMIARAAASYDVAVTLCAEGNTPIDASSTLMVMMMGAQCGDMITVESQDEAAVIEVAGLIERNLDAELN